MTSSLPGAAPCGLTSRTLHHGSQKHKRFGATSHYVRRPRQETARSSRFRFALPVPWSALPCPTARLYGATGHVPRLYPPRLGLRALTVTDSHTRAHAPMPGTPLPVARYLPVHGVALRTTYLRGHPCMTHAHARLHVLALCGALARLTDARPSWSTHTHAAMCAGT